MANAVGEKPAGVYVGRAEVADLQAGERQRLFWQEGESGQENPAACRRSVMTCSGTSPLCRRE